MIRSNKYSTEHHIVATDIAGKFKLKLGKIGAQKYDVECAALYCLNNHTKLQSKITKALH